jgi:Ca2+-binding RTX toxin-like protein
MRKQVRGALETALTPDLIAANPEQFLRAFHAGASTDDIGAARPIASQPIDLEPTLPSGESTFPGPATSVIAPRATSLAAATDATGDFTIQAVVGTFSNGVLTTFGDNLDNNVTISRNAAGQILINGGAVGVTGGTPTVANTSLIQVFGQGGNDVITLSEVNGALPRANLFGGAGNDTLTGGSGADMLFGQAGNDILLGKGGADFIFGGTEDDIITGGDADDQLFGEAGNDRFIWNPGDDTDLIEGGAGTDTVEVNGGNGDEQFTLTANGTRVRFDRLNPAPFSLDIGTSERIEVNMNGGNDTFSATGNLAALIGVRVDGGSGNDTILGSNGADQLLGGIGDDFIDGQQGNDVALLGTGNDVFQWDPGDGSDTVEGGAGVDRMLFNGSAANEIFEASANGGRLRFTRNIANIVMDTNDVETLDLNALGGADTVIVNDMSAQEVRTVNVNLAGAIGGTVGDAAIDNVIVNATNGNDVVDVFGSGTSVSVIGLAAQVNITNSEGANDVLTINTLGGNDSITATTLPAGVTRLVIDAGAGNDTILGSQGADTLFGGDGDDFVFGDNGNDTAFLGAGNDLFQWNPGDGNDTVEGQEGTDRLLFFGANIAENINIVANGGRALFTRDVASVTMDLNDVEAIEFRALGGADNITVGDLSGTDVQRIDVDLRGPNGGADQAVDTVTVNATQGGDTFGVTGDTGGVNVFGLPAEVNLFFTDANDRLVLNGQGGDDVIDASGLEAGAVQLTINGGLGADRMLGSEGDDLITGGDGNDVAFMGAGNDTFVWNPGDDNDTVEGQAGVDTLLFNGANIGEEINIAANGGRVTFTRNVAAVVMDNNDVEHITFNALGGADNILINDLSGTDVTEVNVNLAGNGGVGDAAADRVTANATSGDDVIQLAGNASGIAMFGLAAQVNVTGAEAANDRIVINGLAGDDVIDASGVAAGVIGLTLDGGAGNDIIIGSDGDDIIIGGEGDDVLIGGLGNDIFDSTIGDDIVIQGFTAGAGTEDRIDVRDFGVNFDWLMAHASEVNGDVVFDMGDQDITLRGVSLNALHTDDFLT